MRSRTKAARRPLPRRVFRLAGKPLTKALMQKVLKGVSILSPGNMEVVHNPQVTRIEVDYSDNRRIRNSGRVRYLFDTLFEARAFMDRTFRHDLRDFAVMMYDQVERKRLLRRRKSRTGRRRR